MCEPPSRSVSDSTTAWSSSGVICKPPVHIEHKTDSCRKPALECRVPILNRDAISGSLTDVTAWPVKTRFFYARTGDAAGLAFFHAETDRGVFDSYITGGIMRVLMLMATMLLTSVAVFADDTINSP